METPSSQVVKALTTMSRVAKNNALSYEKTLGSNGLLSQKDISDLRKNNSSLNDDLVVLDRLPSVSQYRREESWAFLTFQTALLTTLPPTSSEEEHFFHCEPYNDSALSSLPVEILIEIFQLVVTGNLGLAEYDVLDVKHSPNWVISHVCRAWRSVALSMPSLWTSVFIEDDPDLLMIDGVPFTENKATLLQEYLTRSNQYPLRVALSSSYDIQKHHEILLPHFTRCTDLDFTVNEEALNMLSTISCEFPGLKRLSIAIDDISHYHSLPRDPRSTTTSPPINGFSKAPHLQEVSLHGISIFHLRLPFPQLLSFTGDISHYFECLILFILSSRLITATLNMYFVPPLSHLSVPFTHTNLHTLSLYTDIHCIRDLRLPALEVFRIERIRSGGYHHIAKLFRESRCPLRSLYLEVPALPWSELQPILEACSSTLTSLSFRVDMVSAWHVFDALSLDGASCLAPRLEELYVRDDTSWDDYMEISFAEDPFLDMVFWRRDSDGEVALLKSLTVCYPNSPMHPYALLHLKVLEIDGLKVEYHKYAWTKKI
ncbi:uncharacterized protein EV420DRAFT_1566470 [Desarmillaria tabescens]|uniref:F-box domain-containing protein n=1 Tax=Armillaria tabescens TaxID=1929756 RepID=A0AA39JUW1_ARMTA|nr:uncharacterized protein EV420DRAFT_1566470 [Desarmillaria tabescens]KAK0448977.1 hypothetical protein EV420DRAFT_1566470 [Desarmillaria tabescens]